MQGFSPKIPLTSNSEGIYSMHTNIVDSIKQDLKMLLLTSPGERVMIPQYGVGLRRYLFLQASSQLISEIESRISQQIKKYMNFITVTDIKVAIDEINENLVNIKITYHIPSINKFDTLNID